MPKFVRYEDSVLDLRIFDEFWITSEPKYFWNDYIVVCKSSDRCHYIHCGNSRKKADDVLENILFIKSLENSSTDFTGSDCSSFSSFDSE